MDKQYWSDYSGEEMDALLGEVKSAKGSYGLDSRISTIEANTYTKDDVYTKTEVDDKCLELSNRLDTTNDEISFLTMTKADVGNVYTKTEIDSKIQEVNEDIQTLDTNLNDTNIELNNLKTNVYTKTEVDDKILDEREYLVNGYYSKTEVDGKISKELDKFRVAETKTVEVGTNIFDHTLTIPNKTVDSNGEIVTTTDASSISQTFEVKSGESAITISYVTSSNVQQLQSFHVAFFDASMNLLQREMGSVHTIPDGAAYFIINFTGAFADVLQRLMVQYGDTMTEFEEYHETVTGKDRIYVKTECIEFVDVIDSVNKFNYNTRTDNASMNTDGTAFVHSYRCVSDYIPCYGEVKFSASSGADGVYCFYDRNKTFISYGVFSNGTEGIAIPNYAHYIRVSLTMTSSKRFMLSFTESIIPYEKYGTTKSVKSDFDRNNCKSTISEVLKKGGQIKFLGDSITHGVGGTGFAQDGELIPVASNETAEYKVNTAGYCFVNLFKNYIGEKYGNTVLNYGTRGIRSYHIVSRIEANNGYVTDEDDLLIVMIGTNNKWNVEPSTLADLKLDIQFIVDWCREKGKKLILVSAPMSSVHSDTQYSDGSAVKFHNEDIDRIYKEVAYENNMDYIPMYQRMVEYCDLKDIDVDTIFADGLHPNDEGHYIMYKILMKELGLAYQMPNSAIEDLGLSVVDGKLCITYEEE